MRLFQDVRFALRVFRKNTGFTTVVVLTLGLGIGGNTALFSLVDQLLLQDLPVRDPDGLIYLSWSDARFKNQAGFSIRDYEAFRRATPVLSEVAALRMWQRFTVEGNRAPELASGEYVAGNYFSLLGVQPVLGRLIEPADDTSERPGVVVLSFGCWQRRFGGDRGAIGRTIRINARPVTIIGVTPRRFNGLSPGYAPDFRLPLSSWPAPASELGRQQDLELFVLGRLQRGVARTQAEAHLRPVYDARRQERAQYLPEPQRSALLSWHSTSEVTEVKHGLYGLDEVYAKPLWLVFAITGVVLLAACVNIAGLLLSQAERRQHETAVRLALGASRGQIVAQFLTESLLLSVFGTLVGILFASWISSLIVSVVPAGGFPRLFAIELGSGLTVRTLLFLAGVCVLTAVLFGLMPAARAACQWVAPTLKSASTTSSPMRQLSLRNLLLAGHIALSLFVVLGATTLIGSIEKLLMEDPGYRKDKLLMVSVDPLMGRYRREQAHQFFDQLLPRVVDLPGVQSATLARYDPLRPTFAIAAKAITVEGYTSKAEEDYPEFWPIRNVVAPNYFRTLGITLLHGRDFNEGDGPNSLKVAIINEQFARHYFGQTNPLGRRIGWNGHADIEIVGVAANVKYSNLRENAKPYWYIPYAQLGPSQWQQMTVQARVAGDAGAVATAIRNEIAALDPSLPIFQITTVEAEVKYHLSRERLVAALSGFFGILAALLAAIGTYGVVSHAVTRRTKEIGIRLALGAERGEIIRAFVADSMQVVLLGIVAGLPSFWVWRKLLTSFAYGVLPTDPMIATLAIVVVAGIALIATFGPVRRAASVDPVVTLHYE